MGFHEFVQRIGGKVMMPEDNSRILEFYDRISMHAERFDVITKKSPDYFRFMKYVAEKFYVVGYPNTSGRLEGMVTLILRPCYIDGKRDMVGHWLDLRFMRARDRTIAYTWKTLGLETSRVGESVDGLDGCRNYHGSYIWTNVYATKGIGKDAGQRSFESGGTSGSTAGPSREGKRTENRGGPAETFQVSNLASYHAVNIRGRKQETSGQFGSPAAGSISVSRGAEGDRGPLKTFLDQQNRAKAFGYVYEGEQCELERRLRDWDGLTLSSFFVARDGSGRIIGSFGAWDPSPGRRVHVHMAPTDRGEQVDMGGFEFLEPDGRLKILYLTALELDHSLGYRERLFVFDRLLDALYESELPRDFHLVSYCDYRMQSLLEVVENGFLYDKTPMVLYQLYAPETKEIYREGQMQVPPGHEMVLM